MGTPEIREIVLTGGAAAGETLNRMKASLFGVPVRVMEMHDGSALGAVKAAGGSLKVDSLPGMGSCFTLWLPV